MPERRPGQIKIESLWQRDAMGKMSCSSTEATVENVYIDLLRGPNKYSSYLSFLKPQVADRASVTNDSGRARLTMSCGRRQRPPEVAR